MSTLGDPGIPDQHDDNNDNYDDNEESTPMTYPDASSAGTAAADTTSFATTANPADTTARDTEVFPDQPWQNPLPYGAGFTPQQYGYGVAPEAMPDASPAVATRERSGSPVLAIAGLLSMGVAVWAILGAPVITSTVMLAASLVIAVLVGLFMVVRR